MRALLALALLLLTAWPAHAARLLTNGFEENGTLASTEWDGGAIGTTGTFSSTSPHSGTYRYDSHATNQSAVRYHPYTTATGKASGSVYTRMYFRVDDATPSADVEIIRTQSTGGTGNWSILLLTTGALRISNTPTAETTDTSTTISADTWYRVEVRHQISDTTGEIELRLYVGDSTTITETLQFGSDNKDTLGGSAIGRWDFGKGGTSTVVLSIDDVGINDDADPGDGSQMSWLGPGKIYLLKPDGDGATTDFTLTSGTDTFEMVNDVPGNPDDSTTQATSATVGHIDRLTLTALGAEVTADATITLAHVNGRVGGDGTAGTREMRFKIWDEGGTLTNGPTNNLNDTASWTNGPRGSAKLVYNASGKTKSNFDSFEAGYEVISAHTTNVSALWVNVEWLEAGSSFERGLSILGVGK
jgi:hypothetical protein